MGKAKVVKKTKPAPKVSASLFQRTSKNSVKTGGRTTMNSSATALMSIPLKTAMKKALKKGAAGGNGGRAKAKANEQGKKKVVVKTAVRKMRSTATAATTVKKSKGKPIKAAAAKQPVKPSKETKKKEPTPKKPVESKKSPPKPKTPGGGPKATKARGAPDEASKASVSTPSKGSANSSPPKKKLNGKVKESKKKMENGEASSSVKAVKVSTTPSRSKSTESNHHQASPSRAPSRRESASSAPASRSRKNSLNSTVGSIRSTSSAKDTRQKEPSPAPKSRRSTVSTETKSKSKSPPPRIVRNRSQSGSSAKEVVIKEEKPKSKSNERSRNKSGSASESASPPASPSSSSGSRRQSPPASHTSPVTTKKATRKAVVTKGASSTGKESEKVEKVEMKEEIKTPKGKTVVIKTEDGAKSSGGKSTTTMTQTKQGSSTAKEIGSSSKRSSTTSPPPSKNKGGAVSKRTEGDKSTKALKAKPAAKGKSSKGASLPTKKFQKVGIGKRMSTVLASAASKSKAQAIKSLLDDRAVARKLASKAIKTKSKRKPKPKLKMRPKTKRRMASLNAKAILEASFSMEQLDKKPKPVSPPKQSPGKQTVSSAPTSAEAARLVIDNITSTSELAARYENLLSDLKIEIRSGPPPPHDSSYASVLSPSEGESNDSVKLPRPGKKRKSKKSMADEIEKVESKKSGKKESLSLSTMTSTDTGTSTSAFIVSPSLTIRERKLHQSSPARQSSASYDQEPSTTKSKKGWKSSKAAGESPRRSSPVPSKKAKKEVSVATAETSTSTPSWGWEPFIPPYPHPTMSGYSMESTMVHQEPGIRHSQQQVYTTHSTQGPSGAETRLQDGYSQSQRYEGLTLHPADGHQYHTKENKSSTPVAHYGSGTVYQPAGPMIEPHKTSMGLGIPETVRLPPDLKVTYQTHPPGNTSSGSKESTTSTQSSRSSHKGHSSKSDGHGRQSSSSSSKSNRNGGHGSSKSSSSQSVVLHQPYKSSSSSSSSMNGSTISSRTVKIQHQQSPAQPVATTTSSTAQVNNSSFSVFGSSGTTATLMGAPGSASTISHQHTLASTNVSLTAHHPGFSGAAPSQGMYYHPNFLGPPAHHSPFAPSKYPIVPPDSFRSPYPNSYLCGPGAAQSSPGNFYMTPFYTPPMTPTSVPVLGSQPRGMLPSHSAAAAATAYYQSTLGPPSAAATSQHGNFGILSPAASAGSSSQLQPSLHSIPSQSSPGHAGPFRPNLSSHPACPCPTDSSLPQTTSISTTNSKSNNTTNTRPLPRLQQLQQQPPPPRCAIPAMRQGSEISVQGRNRNTAFNATRVKDSPAQPSTCTTPAVAAGAPKTLSVHNSSVDITEVRQVESAKTYTEQYSLPDDITITPILVVPEQAVCASKMQSGNDSREKSSLHSATNFRSVSKFHGTQKPKDIVHVIDPRSGQTTTIAKHISNTSNLSFYLNNQKKNVSPVKPNNAGNVGKINPDLDVIVIPPGQNRDQISEIVAQSQMRNKRVFQTSALTSSNSANVFNQHFSIRPAFSEKGSLTSTAVNFVQPLPQVSGHNHLSGSPSSKRFHENPSKAGVKRKGILECIDGLQKKKLKLLEQGTSGTGSHYGLDNRTRILIQPKSPPSAARAMARDQIFQMRNSTIVNEREAMAAASALVVPPNGAHVRLSPHKNGLKRGKGWNVSNLSSSVPHKAKVGNLKITTRSSIANAKIKTRSSIKDRAGVVVRPVSRPIATSVSPEQRPRHRLLRRRVNHPGTKKDGSHGWAHRRFPQSQRYNFVQRWKKAHEESSTASPGSSSSSGSSNGSGPSGITGKSGYASTSVDRGPGYSSSAISVSNSIARTHASVEATGRFRAQIPGSMTFNALKKRAIVKPLSPNVMNGIHSMMLARRQPKWSNGWRFEGDPFEAKVYLRNDDQPVIRRCYPAMRHDGGDTIQARDCVLLKSGPRKTDLPFVAKVAALWENPTDGEMMFSLLWYYRPEHTDLGRTQEDMPDEIFASKHRDCNSVATIEDRCYVLTLNEYCRYKKRLKQLEEGISTHQPLVPLSDSVHSSFSNFAANIALAVWQGKQQGEERRVPAAGKVSPEVVFFCRKVYEFRQKRLLKNPS